MGDPVPGPGVVVVRVDADQAGGPPVPLVALVRMLTRVTRAVEDLGRLAVALRVQPPEPLPVVGPLSPVGRHQFLPVAVLLAVLARREPAVVVVGVHHRRQADLAEVR